MKNYKIKIPKGHEVTNEYSGINDEGMTISITLKPLKKELPSYARLSNKINIRIEETSL